MLLKGASGTVRLRKISYLNGCVEGTHHWLWLFCTAIHQQKHDVPIKKVKQVQTAKKVVKIIMIRYLCKKRFHSYLHHCLAIHKPDN